MAELDDARIELGREFAQQKVNELFRLYPNLQTPSNGSEATRVSHEQVDTPRSARRRSKRRTKTETVAVEEIPKKRTMSAEARKRISKRMKAKWRERRAEGLV